MINAKLRTAFDAAAKVNDRIREINGSLDTFLELTILINCVKEVSGYFDIDVESLSFSEVHKEHKTDKSLNEIEKAGAMSSTTEQDGQKKARIIVNSDYPPEMQRFSVAHELGHLITAIPNFTYVTENADKFTLSAHTNPDITYIKEEKYNNDNYLLAEQVANVFALLVLIRDDIQIKDLTNYGAKELGRRYGVTEEAIYSRLLLANVRLDHSESE